jgi:endonuclease/exonuclease/phosphatase family metal-dependent hydrolase
VALFSETQLKPHERFYIPNFHLYRTDRHPGGTAVAVRKGIPHNHVDLPPLISVEATGVCIPIGNSQVLLAAVYKSPGRAWSDADITELLSFRRKSILIGDLNAKHPLWNSVVSNPSGRELLRLTQVKSKFQRHNTPFTIPMREMDIVVRQNIRVSDVIVSDIFYTDQLPIVFHILDHVKLGIFRNLSKNSQTGSGFKALPQN